MGGLMWNVPSTRILFAIYLGPGTRVLVSSLKRKDYDENEDNSDEDNDALYCVYHK